MKFKIHYECILEVGDRVKFDHNGPGQKRSGTVVGIVDRTYIIFPDKKVRTHNGSTIQGPYLLEDKDNLELAEEL